MDGYEGRLGGEVAVPDVVVHGLKVPDALAGVGVESDEGIGEDVVAGAVCAVEVRGGRADGDEDDAAFGIEGDAGPGVRGAGVLPCIFGPGVVAELAGMGDGVELPADLSGANVKGADVSGIGEGAALRRCYRR